MGIKFRRLKQPLHNLRLIITRSQKLVKLDELLLTRHRSEILQIKITLTQGA